jgi:hypothetical protein
VSPNNKDCPRKRQTLGILAGLSAWAGVPALAHGGAVQLAAWEQEGRFFIGLLAAQDGAGHPLTLRASLEVPTRAHGLHALADGSVLATARRPGDWRVDGSRATPTPSPSGCGKKAPTRSTDTLSPADGQRLYTTEPDLDTGASVVGVRDMRTLAKTAESLTHGNRRRLSLRHGAWSPDGLALATG